MSLLLKFFKPAGMVALSATLLTGPAESRAEEDLAGYGAAFAAAHQKAASYTALDIQPLTDDLRRQLGIDEDVSIQIVKENALLASAQRAPGGGFIISLDEGFLNELDGDEVRAMLAHELGHVWIFTHFPYLQTEAQANDIAMRAVSRENLERLYKKMEQRMGKQDGVPRFSPKPPGA